MQHDATRNPAPHAAPHGQGRAGPDHDHGPLEEIREHVAACMQCGTCSASCPNVEAMDATPRRLWRLAQLGYLEEMASTRTFWLCSACYACTMRCPRGLPLTRVMYALKRLAWQRGLAGAARRSAFYRSFARNVERWGRVQEVGLMNAYLMRMKSPGLALSYVPTGLKLLGKGKLHAPESAHKGVLAPLFARVREMETAAGQGGDREGRA